MGRLVDRLLRIPIFYKVLLANSVIVVIGAGLGTYITVAEMEAHPSGPQAPITALFVVFGLAGSVLVNSIVLRAALQPLHTLGSVAERVRRGDFQARAEKVRIGDPQTDQLTDTLNQILDAVQVYREEVQKLSSAAISAQEEERKRIARELHDETAQSLTSLLVRLRIAERARSTEEMREAIAEVRELTMRTLDEVRKLAVELRPSALDDLGLVPALQWYTKQYADRLGTEVELRVIGLEARLPAEVELVLYRVVQEALTNIAKHATAEEVRILLERQGDTVLASIQDDGHGFDVEQTLQSRERGLGLFGMQERLALVGGHLRIDSGVGQGTRIDVEVPLTKHTFDGAGSWTSIPMVPPIGRTAAVGAGGSGGVGS